jgi:hypothetical protein
MLECGSGRVYVSRRVKSHSGNFDSAKRIDAFAGMALKQKIAR